MVPLGCQEKNQKENKHHQKMSKTDNSSTSKIAKLYENPKTGLIGRNAFIQKYDLDPVEVDNYLHSIDAYTLNAQVKRKFPRIKILSRGVYHQFQADLVDMQQFANENDGIKYLLTCIDVTSRYAWVVPMKNKTAKSTVSAFKTIIDEGNVPELLQTDDGSEFLAKEFQDYCKKEGISHFVAPSNSNCAFVERFHRTLKMRMTRLWTLRANHRYIDHLQDLVDNYNETVHSVTKMKPVEVNEENQLDAIKNSNYYGYKKLPFGNPKYKIGDYVRVTRVRTQFQRETDDKFLDKIFEIAEVCPSVPITYRLKSFVTGEKYPERFYEPELIKYTGDVGEKEYQIERLMDVKTEGRRKMVLVKWAGYDESEASWEPLSNLKHVQGINEMVKEVENKKKKK
jgi:transposase InsO family protein